ncbi:hypothetical protein EMIT0P253_550002 [Pseudomonas sp. IT-P253]
MAEMQIFVHSLECPLRSYSLGRVAVNACKMVRIDTSRKFLGSLRNVGLCFALGLSLVSIGREGPKINHG